MFRQQSQYDSRLRFSSRVLVRVSVMVRLGLVIGLWLGFRVRVRTCYRTGNVARTWLGKKNVPGGCERPGSLLAATTFLSLCMSLFQLFPQTVILLFQSSSGLFLANLDTLLHARLDVLV